MLLGFNVFLPAAGATGFDELLNNLNLFQTHSGLPGTNETSLLDIIFGLINSLLGLLGLLFVVLLLYAGFTYMTAQGDSEKVTKAKATIKNSVIGVAIIILAYVITNVVFTIIVNVANKGKI